MFNPGTTLEQRAESVPGMLTKACSELDGSKAGKPTSRLLRSSLLHHVASSLTVYLCLQERLTKCQRHRWALGTLHAKYLGFMHSDNADTACTYGKAELLYNYQFPKFLCPILISCLLMQVTPVSLAKRLVTAGSQQILLRR
jgi:hypothetical protein